MTKRCAIYARVSTADQDPGVQLNQLRDFVTARGWSAASCEFVDHGVSGAKDSRPGLNAMLVQVRKRQVDVVVIWSLDRLGRSLSHLVRLADEFLSLGVDLACYTQPIDTTTPTGKLTFSILGAVAEFEREIIKSRVRAGIAKARRDGKTLGRPRALVQKTTVEKLRAGGMSVREIAAHTGVSKSVVARLLSSAAA